MNIFRLIGDMAHLLSFLVLLTKIHVSRNVAGISLKTQEMFALVFVCRYLDLFWNFVSVYNSVMKVSFIGFTLTTVWIMRYAKPHSDTYDAEVDSLPHLYLIGTCAVLGLAFNEDHSDISQILWAFSIYLEALAICFWSPCAHVYAAGQHQLG